MEHHDATGVSPETNGVKASPHRLKWMLTRGAPADPSEVDRHNYKGGMPCLSEIENGQE